MVGMGLGIFESAVRAQKGSAPPGDTTAPAKVTDLTLQGAGLDDGVIQWTAAGDDGFTGTAVEFDCRYSAASIVTEGDWSAATSLFGGWTPNGLPGGSYADQYVISPGVSTIWHWAVRYRDEAGNIGPISNNCATQWF